MFDALKRMFGIQKGKRPDVPKGVAKKEEPPKGQAHRPTNEALLAKATAPKETK